MKKIMIKICGITNIEGVLAVNAILPDYAGFVFAESARRVDSDSAMALLENLNSTIAPVGVFVDEEPEHVAKIALECGLSVVQLHGGENSEYFRMLRKLLPSYVSIWKAVRVRTNSHTQAERQKYSDSIGTKNTCPIFDEGSGSPFYIGNLEASIKEVNNLAVDRILLDAWHPKQQGGSGIQIDWSKLGGITRPFVLAGGLGLQNVGEAIRAASPWGVDASSGVETDGKKDFDKVVGFVEHVRSLL